MTLVCFLIASILTTFPIIQSPRESVSIDINGNSIRIDYGRPSLQGRNMLAKAPIGTVWRMGADKATIAKLQSTIVFGNMIISPGSYSLFMERTGEKDWQLILNKQVGQWGTEHDPTQDIYAIPLKWEKQAESTELFTITIEQAQADSAIINVMWGTDVLIRKFRSPDLN